MKEKKSRKRTFASLNWAAITPYIILFALLVVMFSLQSGLLSLRWLGIKTDATLTLILVATGQTLVLLIGGIDLSVGGILCVANSITALYMANSIGGILGMSLAMMALGVVIGLFNGYVIVKLRLQPFIATFASWSILGGVALWILPTDGGNPPAAFINALLGRVFGVIPVSFIIIVVIILLWLYFKNTYFGISVFSIGSNEKSAYLNGIKVNKTKIIIYALSGLFAALAGVYRTAQVASGSPKAGADYILISVAASVIGGTSLAGGKGSVVGAIIGAFILKIIADILVFAHISSYWSSLLQGILLIVAVAISSIASMAKDREVRA
jgi:ribose transport system permease protein